MSCCFGRWTVNPYSYPAHPNWGTWTRWQPSNLALGGSCSTRGPRCRNAFRLCNESAIISRLTHTHLAKSPHWEHQASAPPLPCVTQETWSKYDCFELLFSFFFLISPTYVLRFSFMTNQYHIRLVNREAMICFLISITWFLNTRRH